jgi:putative peptidoglycan lipid II flippase
VLLNLSLIAAAVLLSGRMEVPVRALAWGVLVAGILQLAIQIPALRHLGLLPRPRWGWRHSGVRRILKLMIPTLIGSSVAQVNLLLDTVIATFLVAGSVSWLYYSDRLLEFPLGVFGVALSTVILPNLSRKFASQNPHGFSATLDWALRLAVIITLPAALGLAVLASPILVTLFQYGAFRMSDVDMSALSLSAYAAGLPAFIAVKVLAPGFYARQDTKTPVKIAITAMVSNMVLNLAFVASLLAIGFRGPHTGLALASSVAAYINAGLLYRMLRRQGVYQPESGWARVLLAVALGGAAMVAVLLWLIGEPAQWAEAGALSRALRLAWLIALGAAVYAVATLAGGLRLRHLEKGSS